MARIFISYRRDDAAGHAGRLYDQLREDFGDEHVFMDVDAIGLGSDFRETIDQAIASCDVAIALIGRGWLSASDEEGRRRLDDPDDVLRLELERGLAHGLVVIPTLVQDADLPAERELPDSLAPLARRQGIELRDASWRDDVDRLTRQLEGVVVARAAETSDRRTPLRPRARKLLASALVVLLLGAAAALAVSLRAGGGENPSQPPSTAEARILAAIPLPVRTDCAGIDWGPEAALASVGCGAASVSASYHLFETPEVMTAWYEIRREEANIEPETGTCDEDSFTGETAYVVADETVGRYFCFVDEDEPNLVWTDERATVGVEANVWDDTGAEAIGDLLRQWRCCLELEP